MRESEAAFSPEKERGSHAPQLTTRYIEPGFLQVMEDGVFFAEFYCPGNTGTALVSSSRPFPGSNFVGGDEDNAFGHRRECAAPENFDSLQALCIELFGVDPGESTLRVFDNE